MNNKKTYEFNNGMFFENKIPAKTIAPCIEVYEDVFVDPEKIISSVNELSKTNEIWKAAETFGENQMDKRQNLYCSITRNAQRNIDFFVDLHNQCFINSLSMSRNFSHKYSIEESLFFMGYDLLKYVGKTNDHYDAHYDSPSILGRAISIVYYLNDDYEGGEIEFVNFNLKYKPKANTAICFPSHYPYAHIAHPVTSGDKYVIVTFIMDREPTSVYEKSK